MGRNNAEMDKELEAVLGSHKTRIRIVGAGGGGNNTVTRLMEVGIEEVEIVAVNTDAQDLLYAKADQKILIGRGITHGLGAGSDPERGAEAAKESFEDIANALRDSDMVFITCGLGGGTGTGSAPIIAEIAKKSGALAIAIVTLPFSDEGIVRWDNARNGLEQLQKNVDTVIVVQNDRLLELVPDMPLNAAFKVADEILVNAVKGITELVTEKGLVNLDFADVRTVMQSGGLAMIGLGECENETDAEEAARKALQNPLLDVDVTGAKSALISISGGEEMSLKSAKTIMKSVAERLDPSARIIWGARIDESLGQTIRVMLIVTCLNVGRKSASEVERVMGEPKGDPAKSVSEAPRDFEITESPAEAIEGDEEGTPTAGAEKKNGTKVFSEIFREELDADLIVLEEAIKGLTAGDRANREKFLREVKNACSSIYSSSELFSYAQISDFIALLGSTTDTAIKEEFELSEPLVELFGKVPGVLRGMISEEMDAYAAADDIMEKLADVMELVRNGDAETEAVAKVLSGAEPDDDEEDIDEHREPTIAGESNGEDEEQPGHVKYFDKLF